MWQKNLGIYPIRYHNKLELLKSGNPFFDKLSLLINQAKQTIHFQTYIFEPDQTGQKIIQLLKNAAQRGVKIYMVLDAYGSKNLTPKWQKLLTDSGIQINFFSPFTLANNWHMGMRLHHKIITFDNQTALIGGINISNNYSAYTNSNTWLDFAFFCKGFVVNDLTLICERTLKTVSHKNFKTKIKKQIPSNDKLLTTRVLQNNWLQAKFGISKQYKQQIRKANQSITIFASYFVPSIALIKLLKRASKQGVKVNWVLGSISDTKIVQNATYYFYAELLKANIQIFEWKESVLHAKLALIDNKWLSVGSYNLNHLSDFGSIECNLEVWNDEFVANVHSELQTLINDGCEPVLYENFEQKNRFFHRFYFFICYSLVRFSMNFLFFLQGRNHKKRPKII
jgi:cardiolipin synthase